MYKINARRVPAGIIMKRFIMKKYLENPKIRELISYLFWGVMSTIVSWGSYSLFIFLFGSDGGRITVFGSEVSLTILAANTLSWIIAVAFAFVANKLWVFNSRSWEREIYLPELGKFVSARLITGLLEIVGVPLLEGWGLNQKVFGIEGAVSKITVSIVVVLLNYVFSKLFIFKKTEE